MAAPQALSAEVPDALRSVRALILRGEEVERYAESSGNAAQKRVSYYCFMRAMEKAVESGKTGEPEVQGFLMNLMKKLETTKEALGIDASSAEADKELVLSNALTVFKKADDVDRAGAADKSTARSYNVAANFFDILSQFGPLDAEQEQMRKYAQFKTLDILNALKQGRRPTPGVPGA
ncbi:LIP5, partial [Symbiodinium sp. KB8]